jgi:serine/threonine protein kinase
MQDNHWTMVEELFEAARERTPEERAAFLRGACGGDEAMRQEVESLLEQVPEAASFLSTPAAVVAGGIGSGDGSSLLDRQLGPYAIHTRLGAGGMGEVYRARDTKLGRDVAIKILPHIFTTDPTRRERFDREARLLASLNHPHIGAIYGLEDLDGTPVLILELVEGSTLADRIANGPVPMKEALSIAQQIAEALEAAHESGIIHRDLKPANIKLRPDGVIKVLDFGLAKITEAGTAGKAGGAGGAGGGKLTTSPTFSRGTKEGVILGTAAYLSPEQARGQRVDKRTDIWAFGCVLYEMLTGSAPFPGATVTDTLAAILEREQQHSSARPLCAALHGVARRPTVSGERRQGSHASDHTHSELEADAVTEAIQPGSWVARRKIRWPDLFWIGSR